MDLKNLISRIELAASLGVEPQTVAQGQGPHQAIILDAMASDHLRLCLPIGIEAIERVEDEVGRVAGRPSAGDHRVEHTEIFGGNKDQLVGRLRPPDPRRGKRRNARTGGFEQVAPAHNHLVNASAARPRLLDEEGQILRPVHGGYPAGVDHMSPIIFGVRQDKRRVIDSIMVGDMGRFDGHYLSDR